MLDKKSIKDGEFALAVFSLDKTLLKILLDSLFLVFLFDVLLAFISRDILLDTGVWQVVKNDIFLQLYVVVAFSFFLVICLLFTKELKDTLTCFNTIEYELILKIFSVYSQIYHSQLERFF